MHLVIRVWYLVVFVCMHVIRSPREDFSCTLFDQVLAIFKHTLLTMVQYHTNTHSRKKLFMQESLFYYFATAGVGLTCRLHSFVMLIQWCKMFWYYTLIDWTKAFVFLVDVYENSISDMHADYPLWPSRIHCHFALLYMHCTTVFRDVHQCAVAVLLLL